MPLPTREEEDDDEGPGLIKLDMGAFGSGSISDPLRHAVGMRSAQDQCKMRMWNSFPSLFQNTIFHGEQDAEIASLRRSGTLQERLARGRQLKEAGNAALKAASGADGGGGAAGAAGPRPGPPVEAEAFGQKVHELEAAVLKKEQELKALRKELSAARAELDAARASMSGEGERASARLPARNAERALKEGLEDAISKYEKAAGLLRYVECTHPDWKNDDGSYKGIEDQHLRVEASALEAGGPDAEEARELVASCYLNAALACQRLGDFQRMRAACDEVLAHINAKSVKALYRRAQARLALPSSLEADRDAAVQDLLSAAQMAPQDKEVRGLLAKLRADKRAKEVGDRSAFAGMFDRGEVVTNDPRTEGDRPPKLDLNDPKVQAMLDIHPGPGGFIGC